MTRYGPQLRQPLGEALLHGVRVATRRQPPVEERRVRGRVHRRRELRHERRQDEAVQKLALVTLKLGSSEEECDDQVEDDKWQDDEDDPAPSPATRLWRASLVALTAFRLAAPVGPHAVGVLADNVDAIDLSDADACEAVHEVAPPSAAAWPTPPP